MKQQLLIVGGYFLLSLCFFWRVWVQGYVLFFGDNLLHIGPNMQFWKDQVAQGQIPLWNPYILTGVPHLANPATNTLSPINFFFFLFDNVYVAITWLSVCFVVVTAWGMYQFLKSVQLSDTSAFIGGLVFGFSGTTLAAVNDLNSLQAIGCIPWILWLTQRLVVTPKPSRLAWLSLGLAMQIVSGHPQYAYYTWLLVGVYLLVNLRLALGPKLGYLIGAFGLGFGLAAIQLVPFWELTQQTYRPDTTEFGQSNAVEIFDLPRFLLGNFYGSWQHGDSWGPRAPLEIGRADTQGFVGLIALILAAIALAQMRNKQTLFWAGLSLLSLLLALGSLTPVYGLFRLLPLFDKFRSPERILIIYTLAIAILASYGFEYVRSQSLHSRKT